VAFFTILGACSALAQNAPLKVCISEDNPPYSVVRRGGAVSGFDAALALAMSKALGRELKFVPFEPEVEKDAVLSHEANALLSAGLCDLVSGFPLFQSDLGPPTREKFRPPDYPGAPRKPVRPFVTLGTLVASAPYQGMALAFVQRSDTPSIVKMTDVVGRKIGAVAGTLEGSVISMYGKGQLLPSMVSLSQRDDVWAALESGSIDTHLTPTTALDTYLVKKPDSKLRASELKIPLGVNMGFVALADRKELLEAVNRFIAEAQTNGELQRLARASGMTWQAPAVPAVSQGLSLPTLLGP
jgi:ABC-type amino acid transport substrate-binding protein